MHLGGVAEQPEPPDLDVLERPRLFAWAFELDEQRAATWNPEDAIRVSLLTELGARHTKLGQRTPHCSGFDLRLKHRRTEV